MICESVVSKSRAEDVGMGRIGQVRYQYIMRRRRSNPSGDPDGRSRWGLPTGRCFKRPNSHQSTRARAWCGNMGIDSRREYAIDQLAHLLATLAAMVTYCISLCSACDRFSWSLVFLCSLTFAGGVDLPVVAPNMWMLLLHGVSQEPDSGVERPSS